MSVKEPSLTSDLIRVFLPLLLIPATFILVLPFGHEATNLFIGAVFACVFLWKADVRGRRLMVMLSAFAFVFETANVGTGFYSYTGYNMTPLWVAMGWSVLGWYIVSLIPVFRKVPDWVAYAVNALALLAVAVYFNFWHVSMLFAAVGVALFSKTTSRVPGAFFAFGSLMGLLIEVSGTALSRWTYYSAQGLPTTPEFGQLALGYSVALLFCFWLAGYDRLEEKD
ncbi:MAG: hypothetical protein WCX64_05095 [Candidatus Micrarchaeia archaeon]